MSLTLELDAISKLMPNWVLVEVSSDWDNKIITTMSGLFIDRSWSPNETAIITARCIKTCDKIKYKRRPIGKGKEENKEALFTNPMGTLEAWQEFDIGVKPEVSPGDNLWIAYTEVFNAIGAGMVSKKDGRYLVVIKYDSIHAGSPPLLDKGKLYGVNGKYVMDFRVLEDPDEIGGIALVKKRLVTADGEEIKYTNKHIGKVIAVPKTRVADYFWEDIGPDRGYINDGDIVISARSHHLENTYLHQNKMFFKYCHDYEIIAKITNLANWEYTCNYGFVEVQLMENPMSKIIGDTAKFNQTLRGRVVTTNPDAVDLYGKIILFSKFDLVPIQIENMYFTFVKNVRSFTLISESEYYVDSRR